MPRISIKALRKCVANNTVSFTGTSDVNAEKRKDHVIVDTTGVDVNTNKSKKRKAGEMNLDGNGTGGSTGTTNSTKNATSELSKPSVIELHDKGDFNNDRTIYMEGLPFTSNEDEVKSVFASCGKILQIRLPRWHDSTRLLGYGHILFSNASAAKKALELDGTYIQNRYIKVTTPMTPKVLQDTDKSKVVKPPGCKTVFVKNIPYEATENDITDALRVCGPIVKVRLAMWGHTKKSKGFGYVDFKREESAEIAVKKSSQIEIKGRKVMCDFETGAPKASYRPTTQDK